MQIKSLGFADALVRIDGENISVTVVANKLAKSRANEIIYLVKRMRGCKCASKIRCK